MESSKECFFPLHGLIVDSQGSYGHCLTSKCRVSSIEELDIIRSSQHQTLKLGQWPKECSSCEQKEKKGIQSRREKFINSKVPSLNQKNLEHIEINFSNICNLTCAMCTRKYSSSWIALEEEMPEFKNIATLEKNKTFRISEEQLNSIIELSVNAKTIIIKGGEPTLDPNLKYFLKRIDQLSNENSFPKIFIQSNGSQDPNKWIPDIQHLNIELGISIDGAGETYQWIRGQSIELVKKNIRAAQAHPNIKNISIDFTLSVFSILVLPDFLEMALQLKTEFKKIEFCTFFQWAQDSYNTIGLLSPDLRKDIFIQSQQIFSKNPDFFLNFKSIQNLLLSDTIDIPNTRDALQWIHLMNLKRGLSLFDIQPKLKIDLERV